MLPARGVPVGEGENTTRTRPNDGRCGPHEGACEKLPGCECHLHLVDTPNNTYLGVRLLNDTDDLSYSEFYANNLDSKLTEEPYFYELYDTAADPHQLRNLAINPTPRNKAIMAELHEYAREQFACKGSDCA